MPYLEINFLKSVSLFQDCYLAYLLCLSNEKFYKYKYNELNTLKKNQWKWWKHQRRSMWQCRWGWRNVFSTWEKSRSRNWVGFYVCHLAQWRRADTASIMSSVFRTTINFDHGSSLCWYEALVSLRSNNRVETQFLQYQRSKKCALLFALEEISLALFNSPFCGIVSSIWTGVIHQMIWNEKVLLSGTSDFSDHCRIGNSVRISGSKSESDNEWVNHWLLNIHLPSSATRLSYL